MGEKLDQPLLLQLTDRFSNGAAAHTQSLGEPHLEEPGTRRQLSVQDASVKAVENVVAKHPPGSRRESRTG